MGRTSGPYGVEVDAQHACQVDGTDAPVWAVRLKAERTVPAAAPRGADGQHRAAVNSGDPVERGGVQARRSADLGPAASLEAQDQRLRRAAGSGRPANRPHGARGSHIDRVQPVAVPAEPRQPRNRPAPAIPVLCQRSIDPPRAAVADGPDIPGGCRSHRHKGVVPRSRVGAGDDAPSSPVPVLDQGPGRPARGAGQSHCPRVRRRQGDHCVQEAASGTSIRARDCAPGSVLPVLCERPCRTPPRHGHPDRPHVVAGSNRDAEQLIGLASAGRAHEHVPPLMAGKHGNLASGTRGKQCRCQSQTSPRAQVPEPCAPCGHWRALRPQGPQAGLPSPVPQAR